jgi:hypothetical protein
VGDGTPKDRDEGGEGQREREGVVLTILFLLEEVKREVKRIYIN